jgi:hypothetical protein
MTHSCNQRASDHDNTNECDIPIISGLGRDLRGCISRLAAEGRVACKLSLR